MDFSIASLVGIALGIGLAAATGFRIFIPLLLVGLAARFDMLPLGESFQWLSTTPALLTLGTAAVLETLGYYIGGGAAGLTKGSTALLRAKSGVATGGLANPVVSTVETVGATGLTILAIAVPVLCFVAVVVLLWWVARKAGRLMFGRRKTPQPPATT